MDAAAGIGVLGFWIFLASVVVAGIWFDARKRESQQETLRRVVESGQQLDEAVIDKMLDAKASGSRPDRELKVSAIIMLSIAPGMPVLGWFLSKFNDQIFGLMVGVGLLISFIALGMYVASVVTERWYLEDQG
jgi:hypothetical protein